MGTKYESSLPTSESLHILVGVLNLEHRTLRGSLELHFTVPSSPLIVLKLCAEEKLY